MESTNLPFNQALEQEIQAWQRFRRALRKQDQQCLDRLFERARLHAQAGGVAAGKLRSKEKVCLSDPNCTAEEVKKINEAINLLEGK